MRMPIKYVHFLFPLSKCIHFSSQFTIMAIFIDKSYSMEIREVELNPKCLKWFEAVVEKKKRSRQINIKFAMTNYRQEIEISIVA